MWSTGCPGCGCCGVNVSAVNPAKNKKERGKMETTTNKKEKKLNCWNYRVGVYLFSKEMRVSLSVHFIFFAMIFSSFLCVLSFDPDNNNLSRFTSLGGSEMVI